MAPISNKVVRTFYYARLRAADAEEIKTLRPDDAVGVLFTFHKTDPAVRKRIVLIMTILARRKAGATFTSPYGDAKLGELLENPPKR